MAKNCNELLKNSKAVENYSGTLRISNPRTLQSWIDKGWYQKQIDNGYIFNVGCGRFKTEICTCSTCRNRTRPELKKIIENIKP